jgi:hypothetical protein
VCLDSTGLIIKVIFQVSLSCDTICEESLDVHLTTSMVVALKLSKFTLEGGFLVVVMALQCPSIVQD